MFKLESYISPWLMGYLDRYVKLRPEDLQLSLWGGDAVLYNLDLRLDVLEKAVQLPITFKSGHIHELRLHVPWTKLGSEPILITINTVECILKVRDKAYENSSGVTSGSSTASFSKSRQQIRRQTTEELPPGYLQSLFNRIVNNMTFIVNNLILKFVEDDIVLSVNVKSAECYSCDSAWKRAFVDITPSELVLRKTVNFSDLTICLDKSSADGRIENYQEPMLYRCFIMCRMHLTYDSVSAKLPAITRFNVFCEKLDLLLTDSQLPMFIRLIELFLALYYGYLDLPSKVDDPLKPPNSDEVVESSVDGGERVAREEDDVEEQSWAAWMWSMVPQILPDEEDEDDIHTPGLPASSPVLSLGLYIQQAAVTFKLTEQVRETSSKFGASKLLFHPFLVLDMSGLAVEVLMQGYTFFSVQCGISRFTLTPRGHCICGHRDAKHGPQTVLIVSSGETASSDLCFHSLSLFDPQSSENHGERAQFVLTSEGHREKFTEAYGLKRFGAFWMDYLSTLVLPESGHANSQTSDTDGGDSTLFHRENSACLFVFGPSNILINSSAIHRIHKFLCCAWNHQYEPYKHAKQPNEVKSEHLQLTETQVKELEEFIPTCTYHLTLLHPSVTISAADHPHCHMPSTVYVTRRAKSKRGQETIEQSEEAVDICVSAERFDLQLLKPMYPGRLARLVSHIVGPSSNLLHHCHSHTQVKMFSLQAGLRPGGQRGKSYQPVTVLPPCSMAAYFRSLVWPEIWKNSHLPLWEHSYELVQGSLAVSKASLLAVVGVLSSWMQSSTPPHSGDDTLLADLFHDPGKGASEIPVLEVGVSGVELRSCHTPLVQAYTGSLSSLQAVLYIPGNKGVSAVPVLCGPVDVGHVADRERFQNTAAECMVSNVECITFTVQKPHHTSIAEAPSLFLVNMEGIAGCLDPGLLQWFAYTPRPKVVTTTFSDTPAAAVDVPLAEATSPLQVTGSQVSVRSGSSHNQRTSSRLYSQSQPTSRPHPQSAGGDVETTRAHQEGSCLADTINSFLVEIFPLLRKMQVQADVKASCLFLPRVPLVLAEGSADIGASVQCVWWAGQVEDVLVMCLPSISVHSTAATPVAILQDIPVTLVDGSLLNDKLPWTVQVKSLTAYTLHRNRQSLPLLEGLNVTSTVGATVQYSPPTSDNIQAIAFCVHVDITPVSLALSPAQVTFAWQLASLISEMLHCVRHLCYTCYSQCLGHDTLLSDSHDGRSQSDQDSGGVRQQEVSAAVGSPEVTDLGTTDVSEDTSQEPLHLVTLSDSSSDHHSVKLSLWLQGVLPRLTLTLSPTAKEERHVKVLLEDLAVSCDVQQVYLKLKTKLGSVAIKNYLRSPEGSWMLDDEMPVVMSTQKELPHRLSMYRNQTWNLDKDSTQPAFLLPDSFSGEKAHDFFSLTYTQAVCKNVRRKMRKMNVELTSMMDQEEEREPARGLFFHKLVSEVCVQMEPLDVVLHQPTIEMLMSLVSHPLSEEVSAVKTEVYSKNKQSSVMGGVPVTEPSCTSAATHTLPLLHVDVGVVRLFVPVKTAVHPECESGEQAVKSTLSHDMFLLQMDSLHVQSHADNPLPRYPVERDIFLRALQTEMLHQTGSCVEDRQYQLQCKGLALSSGQWSTIMQTWRRRRRKESHRAPVSPGAQNPALEWNTYLEQGPVANEARLVPMAAAFNMSVVVAPPIVYDSSKEQQSTLVCGWTAELNILSDLDLQLSAQQLLLLSQLTASVTTLTSTVTSPTVSATPLVAGRVHTACDSGVASERSSATQQEGQSLRERRQQGHVPVDVLLTAGRISLTLYSHTYLTESPSQDSTQQSASKGCRKERRTEQLCRKDNFVHMTQSMAGTEVGGEEDDGYLPFSFMQPKSDDPSMHIHSVSGVCVQPFVYVYVAQPHIVVGWWPERDKVELSCYDILVKGSKSTQCFPVGENRLMPDLADFDTYWVETRAGQPHPKTGVPPSLLTLHVTNVMSTPAGIEVKVERPVKVKFGQHTLQQVVSFMKQLTPTDQSHSDSCVFTAETESLGPLQSKSLSDPKPETGRVQSKQSLYPTSCISGLAGAVESGAVRTEQVVIVYEAVGTQYAGLFTSISHLTLDLRVQQNKTGCGVSVQASTNLQDIVVKTLYGKNQHVLVGPVSVSVDTLLRRPSIGPLSVPQVIVSLQAGLLLLRLGQETALCLQALGLLPQEQVTGRPAPCETGVTKPSSAAPQRLPPIAVHRHSHDDLRAGAFSYIQSDGSKEWPDAWEIVFSEGDAELGIDSMMTWMYPEPRLITNITTLPVPFITHQLVSADQLITIPCWLQYWDDRQQMFVDYARFELSESAGGSVVLPEVKVSNISSLAVSCWWRLVLGHTDTGAKTQSAGRGKPVVLAMSLAASVCVDSCYAPSLIPVVQVSLSVASVQLHLYNHLHYNGTEVPGKLRRYKMSSALPLDQQWAVANMHSLVLLASHSSGPHSRTTVELSGQVEMEVLDYHTLAMLPVVDPVEIQVTASTLHHQQPSVVESLVKTGMLHVHLGPSVLHTINTSLVAWSTFASSNKCAAVIFSHLIFCNNTSETLRLGQVGTDENVAVEASHMLPYSWRSYQCKQLIHVCLDHPTWRWCSPISLEKDGHFMRVVRARDQRYTLIIRVTHLTPVCRQVTISGQLLVGSCLSLPLEVCLAYPGADGDNGSAAQQDVYSLEAGKMLPSFVAEHEEVAGIRLRLAGYHLSWSHIVHIAGTGLRDNQLLKLLLPDGVSFFHVWCRIFCKAYGDARQKLILLSPLYVLRSHLPRPVFVRMETGHGRQHQELEVRGRGQEYQLHCTGGDISHHISFRLGMELPFSSPPVILSSGLVDQVHQEEETSVDLETMCDVVDADTATPAWPYTHLPAATDGEVAAGGDQVSVDLNIHLSQYLSGCRTLLVDIAPWCLLTNATPLPLVLVARDRQLGLPSGSTIAPPALQSVQLGLWQAGELCLTTCVPLSEDEVEQHRYSAELGHVLFLDGCVPVQLLLPAHSPGAQAKVVPLTMTSAMVRGMRIVTIGAQLLVSNTTGLCLQMQLMAVPVSSSKVEHSRFHVPVTALGPTASSTAMPALDWCLLADSSSDSQSLALAHYIAFRLNSTGNTTQTEGSSGCCDWSVPVRVHHSQDSTRLTVALPIHKDGVCCSVAVCVTCQQQGTQTYIILTQDRAPFCVLHNYCPFPINFGQTVSSLSSLGCMVQEEMELLETVPVVQSGGWTHYTMPHINTHFPSLDTTSLPHLHVRALLPAARLGTTHAAQGSDCADVQQPSSFAPSAWSVGIDPRVGNTFLQLADVANIKVNIKQVSSVMHITLEVLNKAEVLAKEIRSRIKGSEGITVDVAMTEVGRSPRTEAAFDLPARSAPTDLHTVSGHGALLENMIIGVFFEGLHLTMHDDLTKPDVISELLHMHFDRVLLANYLGGMGSTCLAVCVGDLQVDNPLTQEAYFDFPVVLRPRECVPEVLKETLLGLGVMELHAVLRGPSVLHGQLVVSSQPQFGAGLCFDSVDISVKPLTLHIEDCYFYRLSKELARCMPTSLSLPHTPQMECQVPLVVQGCARVHQHPLRIMRVCVQSASLLLSVHASVKLFLATDEAPLAFRQFERRSLFTCTQQLAYTMALHYLTSAVFRAGAVVGAMEILGSPTGLVRSMSAGMSDLVYLPYHGLTNSPTAFIGGVFGGIRSFIGNTTAGIVTSVTNFASSLSRNMDQLSLDVDHKERQDETRRHRPTGLSSGLHQGLTGFGLCMLGAVAGLVDQPLQMVVSQQSGTSTASVATSTASSLLAGMGKGLVGAITKPIAGAAQLVSQTGQGLLQSTGLRQQVEPRCQPSLVQRLALAAGWLKYPMKLLLDTELLIAAQATQEDLLGSEIEVVLLLTRDMVAVVNCEDDAQQQAFSLSQLQCSRPAPAILLLQVADTVFHSNKQTDHTSTERVAAFISSSPACNMVLTEQPDHSSSSSAVSTSQPSPPLSLRGRSHEDDEQEDKLKIHLASVSAHGERPQEPARSHSPVCHTFHLDPYWCQLFVALFSLAHNNQKGKGFVSVS